VPIGNGIRIGVAIFSYCGALNVGVTGDYESAGDIDVLCAGVEDGLAELVKAAKRVA
jgi:diacylglycerol O-acyltransferase